MAAPTSEYRTIPFESMRASVLTVNQRAIPTAVESVLLSRFYLDRLLIHKDKQGNEGFIGLCIEGGANYLMHNPNRLGSIRIYLNGLWYVAWKDGGLNTKGKSISLSVPNDAIGELSLSAIYMSAFWVNTDRQGFEWKVPGFANTTSNFGSQPMNTTLSKTRNLNENDQNYQVAGNYFEVRAYVTNAEGTWYSDWLTFLIKPRQMLMKFNAQYASSAYNGTATRTVFVGTHNLMVGTNLYSSVAMTEANLPAQGYYTFNEEWFEVRYTTVSNVTYARIVATGQATASGWPKTDPAYDSGARVRQEAHFNSGGFEAPCDNYYQNLLPNRIIWKNTIANERYFTQEVGGTEVPNGWYVWNGIWHQMVGGYIVGTGSCPTGN